VGARFNESLTQRASPLFTDDVTGTTTDRVVDMHGVTGVVRETEDTTTSTGGMTAETIVVETGTTTVTDTMTDVAVAVAAVVVGTILETGTMTDVAAVAGTDTHVGGALNGGEINRLVHPRESLPTMKGVKRSLWKR
jgi:hypothetical protein